MEEPIFKPDDIVEFQGLVKSKDDNGKQGVILGYDSKKKRYEVAVKWAPEPKKLKAENLKKVEPPPKAPEPPQPQRPSPPKQRTNSRSRSTTKPKEGKKRSRSKSGKNGERARTEKSPEKETKKRAASKGRRSRSRKSRRRSRSRKLRRRSRSRKSRRRSRSRSQRRRSRSPSDKKRARHEAAPAQSGREGVAPASMPAALASNLAPMRTEQKAGQNMSRALSDNGKGGGKGNKGRNFQISKALARILRHTAQSLGLQIRADGFCQLQDILALNEFTTMGATAEDVQVAVQSNDKKRFETKIEADKVLIRAVQGHSMKTVDDNSLLKRLNADDPHLPKVCVHGTYRRNVDSIQRNGLLVGGGVSQRNHVHFAPYEPHDGRVISGMRYNCEVAIYIDLPTAIREGVPFFQSANEVILSPGINGTVPAKYISKVRDLSGSQ